MICAETKEFAMAIEKDCREGSLIVAREKLPRFATLLALLREL